MQKTHAKQKTHDHEWSENLDEDWRGESDGPTRTQIHYELKNDGHERMIFLNRLQTKNIFKSFPSNAENFLTFNAFLLKFFDLIKL